MSASPPVPAALRLLQRGVAAAERGLVPDALLRAVIRQLCRQRLREVAVDSAGPEAEAAFAEAMRAWPVAVEPEAANRQHYELPPAFFEHVLGPRLKYSCAAFEGDVTSLEAAEVRMLERTCERAGLRDGMRVLDLGSGWGSLSLWIAERYPHCEVLGVSNSALQAEHVRAAARARGLASRLRIQQADARVFDPAEHGRFDRVMSVEMFEHMRGWPELFRRVRGALAPEGRFFLHVFCHRTVPYLFEDRGPGDWMARHFFTGGIMPSVGLAERFPDLLEVEARWRVDGRHYARTAEAWLARLDAAREPVLEILRGPEGGDATRALGRWRLFFLAVAELFGTAEGREWFVGHYRLAPPSAAGEGVA